LHVAVKHSICAVTAVLLANKRAHITEEVVKAAAGNWGNGNEIMTLLLNRRGSDIH
jgi:hypothetical protein